MGKQKILDFSESFKVVSDTIKKNENFLILTHEFPDGDSIGSQIALFALLKSLNKKAAMICSSNVPYQYKFLPYVNNVKKDPGDDICINKDCICICLDSADEDRFNLDFDSVKTRVKYIINIDHHPGNSQYGDINIVDSNKSATAEILYEIIIADFKNYLSYDIAIGIYTGILTDTGRFQYTNTTSNVHKIVSHLLEYGIIPAAVFSCIYENEPFNRFKLLELFLKRIKLVKSKKFIYSYLLKKDFEKLNLPFSSSDGIIELLRAASDAKIAALLKEVGKDNFKISLRSSDKNYDVAEIAAKFGGGGHKMASAYASNGNIDDLISSLTGAIKIKTAKNA